MSSGAQKAVEATRKAVARKPALKAELQAEWDKVVDVIGAHATAKKLKSFEFHHMTEIARASFLIAFQTAKFIVSPELSRVALEAVKLQPVDA